MGHAQKKGVRLFIVAAAWLSCAMSARGGLVIDDFSDVSETWPQSITSPNVLLVNETNLSGVVGGTRLTTLSAFVFDIEGLDQVRATIAPQFGVLDYASSVGADGDLRLGYVGKFSADLSGDAFIQIDFAGFDMGGNVPMTVTVEIGTGALTATLTQMLVGVGAQSLAFNFSEFTGIGAIDLAGIDAMEFRFNPGAGGDFRIAGIASIVPEPATLVMLLVGAGAIVCRRRVRIR